LHGAGGHYYFDAGKGAGRSDGGFTSSKKEIVQLLRNRSRPYLFSNTVAPTIVAASLAVVDLIQKSDDLTEEIGSQYAEISQRG
jgi:glycine C-acetyltransferase